MISVPVATAAIFGFGGVTFAAAAWLTDARFEGPGIGTLAWFSTALAVVSFGGGAFLLYDPVIDQLMDYQRLVANTIWAFAPLWLVFALEYTGRQRLLTRDRLLGFAAVGGGFFVLNLYVALGLGLDDVVGGLVLAAFYLLALVLAGLYFVGSGIVLWSTYRRGKALTDSGAALAGIGIVLSAAPLLGFALVETAGSPETELWLAGVSAVVGTSTLLLVARSDALASTAVAAGTVAQERAFLDLADAGLVLDDEDHIVQVNEAAVTTFGLDRDRAIGRQFEAVLGVAPAQLQHGDPTMTGEIEADGGTDTIPPASTVSLETTHGTRQFDVRLSALEERPGRQLGTVVTFRDVTERELRRQRIAILNRVLRHNLRNKLSIVRGSAELIENDDHDLTRRIERAADDLLALSEQARETQALLTSSDRRSELSEASRIVSAVVEETESEHPTAEITVRSVPDVPVQRVAETLRFVLRELLDNGAKHNDAEDPQVVVSGTVEDDRLHVTVADNGPGIPQQERVAITDRNETALHHASGLGLWSVRWAVTAAGGSAEIDDREPRGTAIEITLPIDDRHDSEETPSGNGDSTGPSGSDDEAA